MISDIFRLRIILMAYFHMKNDNFLYNPEMKVYIKFVIIQFNIIFDYCPLIMTSLLQMLI
jgi:hypothetical protein